MDEIIRLLSQSGFANLTFGNWLMYAVSGTLVFLAIKKEYEPLFRSLKWVPMERGSFR
jgi:Na+-transporting methylmalonyl-CoA/oxaloacetate decarboxylase beta subunit